ncbi:Rossmann-fold NAD(P)-binding domain-containing protein [Algiphilus aromaticivorans]|jgi:uncharacterized protein YbjT (DUF2867 family)|uniref:hypothetical protein n=1 Tax=Algiphilus aromaticivorans TaxID=382454 RepID=UPI0005C1B044|nr:hypothetical protein [Algiphilus aromaticivorans]
MQDLTGALLAGGTGLVGGQVLESLRRLAVAPVHALARTPRADSEGLHWHDWAWFDADPLPECAMAFCCLGTTHAQAGSKAAFAAVDRDLVLHFAERARAAGVTRFGLVSSVGADAGARSHYLRIKGQVEDAISAMAFDALHIIRPSLLLGSRGDSRPAEDLAQRLAPVAGALMAGPLRRYRPVGADKVARQLVHAVVAGEAGRHVHYPWLAGKIKNA